MTSEKTEAGARRRAPRWMLYAGLALVAGAAAIDLTARFGPPPIEGVYLTKGGTGYVVIEPGEDGLYYVTRGTMEREWDVMDLSGATLFGGERNPETEWALMKTEMGLDLVARRLDLPERPTARIMLQDITADLAFRTYELEDWNPRHWQPVLRMMRSDDRRGDFDLTSMEWFGWRLDFEVESPEYINSFDRPLVSYLHRVEDERMMECLDAIEAEQYSRAMDLASQMAADHDEDLYLRGLHMETALRGGNWIALRATLEQMRDSLLASTDPYLQRMPFLVDHALLAHDLTLSGRNAYDLSKRLGRQEATWDEWVEGVSEFLNYEYSAPPLAGLDPAKRSSYRHNFEDIFHRAKSIGVESVFAMMAGERQRALDMLSGIYRDGFMLAETPGFAYLLIGPTIENWAMSGLELYALNTVESAEEIAKFMERLESIDSGRPHRFLTEGGWFDSPLERAWIESPLYQATLHGDTIDRRNLSARARFLMLKVATAARYRLLSMGEWPGADGDFAPLLADGMPRDPFGDRPILYYEDGEDFVVYSAGPDLADDRGQIVYDPSNGSGSAGDIVLRVPRERRYPFPAGGVRAATAEEVQAMFPHGLPPDIYAARAGSPLNIAIGSPVRIYSWGPDLDQAIRIDISETWDTPAPVRSVTFEQPEAPYDPSNGLTSDGDIIWSVPRPTPRPPA